MIDNKLIILVGKDGRPSMKGTYSKMINTAELWVRRRLIKKSGKIREYFRQYVHNIIDKYIVRELNEMDFTNRIIVRWGNTIPVQLDGSIVYNKAEAIKNATDKLQSRLLFIKNGINTPKLINSFKDIQQNDYPIIARPIYHAKGKNFITFDSVHEYNQHKNTHDNWYYSAFIDKTKEFRVHVAHGRILNYLEKPKPENPEQIAWNRALNGEAFENVKWSDYNNNVCKEAIKAIDALDLDFGKLCRHIK